jgi:UDP-N-acetylglucosamine:LPS N-acetylglucosamine transferase
VFRRVIVPSEAFEELNGNYSHGSHVHVVGPVVQRTRMTTDEREALRGDLAKRFGRDFRHLVVTMLGGGVAADRSAQIAATCAMMASRADTLHLAVVWPNATVEAGAFTWPNTRIVKTHHAGALVAACDLFISAAGYNSFHEVIYNRVPAIFMAQMSTFMDDQRRRAMAAVDRGLADIIEPHEMHALRAKVANYLEGGRSQEIREQLETLELPEPGTADAARLIMEIAECPRPAGRTSLPASATMNPRTSMTSFVPTTPGPPIPAGRYSRST